VDFQGRRKGGGGGRVMSDLTSLCAGKVSGNKRKTDYTASGSKRN